MDKLDTIIKELENVSDNLMYFIDDQENEDGSNENTIYTEAELTSLNEVANNLGSAWELLNKIKERAKK